MKNVYSVFYSVYYFFIVLYFVFYFATYFVCYYDADAISEYESSHMPIDPQRSDNRLFFEPLWLFSTAAKKG